MTIDKNMIGYHKTGERYDYFLFGGFGCIINTLTNSVSEWMSIEETEKRVKALNDSIALTK